MSAYQFDTVEQKASYGIGLQMGQQLAASRLQNLQVDAIAVGIAHALQGLAPAIAVDDINHALRELHDQAEQQRLEQGKKAGAAGAKFLQENAKRSEVKTTGSGLQYEVLTQGSGKIPTSKDTVSVHYHGTLIDGQVFDSSVERGQPAQFGVTAVIKGWVEALQLMPVGSKWRLYIPHELAYGERGAGEAIAPYSALIFDVELLAIV
ncbi:MAG: FKBP-type peptidyl-prolyl cis-trans isomerase [Vibrionaceae bacterium]